MKKLSKLIPKNHFCSFFLFREEPLINWTFTESVLFTAYDIYRSNNFWIDEMMRQGKTLKEGLVELGFPTKVSLVADTGIFEIEAKKAGIARKLGIEVDFELSNDEIFQAYEISGADFFVAPDEIIMPLDRKDVVRQKIAKIKDNMRRILELFPSNKIIGVIQGCKSSTITNLFDFFRECGIRYFARGGVIPLYKHNKELFKEILTHSREITKGYWLHTFGLPRVSLLPYYINEMGFDSVDTSLLLYLTGRKQYLIGTHSRPIRLADLSKCGCQGCNRLQELKDHGQVFGKSFFVALYIHNIIEATQVTTGHYKKITTHKSKNKSNKRRKKIITKKEIPEVRWRTVHELLDDRIES